MAIIILLPRSTRLRHVGYMRNHAYSRGAHTTSSISIRITVVMLSTRIKQVCSNGDPTTTITIAIAIAPTTTTTIDTTIDTTTTNNNDNTNTSTTTIVPMAIATTKPTTTTTNYYD